MPSKQNYKAITKWKSENTDNIKIEPKKSICIPARIQLAIDAGKSTSRQAYIISAILEKLERDGIPVFEDASTSEEEQ